MKPNIEPNIEPNIGPNIEPNINPDIKPNIELNIESCQTNCFMCPPQKLHTAAVCVGAPFFLRNFIIATQHPDKTTHTELLPTVLTINVELEQGVQGGARCSWSASVKTGEMRE